METSTDTNLPDTGVKINHSSKTASDSVVVSFDQFEFDTLLLALSNYAREQKSFANIFRDINDFDRADELRCSAESSRGLFDRLRLLKPDRWRDKFYLID